MRQEYYEFDAVHFSTYAQVVYLFLDTHAVNEFLVDADATLRDMWMEITGIPPLLVAFLMNSSLHFGVVYIKAQLVPINVGSLPEILRGVVFQKISVTSNIVYDRLVCHAEVLHKIANSTSTLLTFTSSCASHV